MSPPQLIMTLLPSFYKVRLYNELAKREDIVVVFVLEGEATRNHDFLGERCHFPFLVLRRPGGGLLGYLRGVAKLINIAYSRPFSTVTTGGWEQLEYWLALLLPRGWHRRIVMESTALESRMRDVGINALKRPLLSVLKRLFLRQVDVALVAGVRHQHYLEQHGFRGEFRNLRGVGLSFEKRYCRLARGIGAGRFLFLGRFVPEKNLAFTIRAFLASGLVERGCSLTLVGEGPLKEELIRTFGGQPGIVFSPYVSQAELPDLLSRFDALVLLSAMETYGLVLEEALKCGMPVLVSDRVGAVDTLVRDGVHGRVVPLHEANCAQAFIELASAERYDSLVRAIESDESLGRIREDQLKGYATHGG